MADKQKRKDNIMKAIKTKYLPATDRRGSRIKASDSDGNSITVSYDSRWDSYRNHELAALDLCIKMKWSGRLIGGEFKNDMYWVFVEGNA